jgi:hypothetical protein
LTLLLSVSSAGRRRVFTCLSAFASTLLSTVFFCGCNKLVRSDPRGLSIGKGKGAVITSKFFVTPMEVVEGVFSKCFDEEGPSSSPCSKLATFLFFGAEGFDASFDFFVHFFFLPASTDLCACLVNTLTTLFLFNPLASTSNSS